MPATKQDKVLLACPHCGHQQRESRSAYSTIAITVTPDLPVIVYTPTPTSTPRPTPTPVVWKPSETAKESWDTLKIAYQGIMDFLIWFFVVLVPILAPWGLLVWVIVRLVRRKPKA